MLNELRDIMRDNMLVNVSGLEGHAMPIDLNMEHLIGQLKVNDYRPNQQQFLICFRIFLLPKIFSQHAIGLGTFQQQLTT
jgi:hypothetical protein